MSWISLRMSFFTFFWSLGSPSVDSEPMKTCLVGGNVTLTCHVSGAYPQAKILWLRNLTQPEMVIQPNSHYLITQKGQRSTLTIRNCSHNLHEGYYICRAENPVGMREVNIWLTVKSEWWKWPQRRRGESFRAPGTSTGTAWCFPTYGSLPSRRRHICLPGLTG